MELKTSGKTEEFSSGSIRDSAAGKPPLELIPFDLLERVAVWYGLGGQKYGNNNWRKGQKSSHVLGSLLRHLSKYIRGEKDEDHLAAVIWNAFCLMNNDTYRSSDTNICDIQEWWEDGKPTGK